MEFFFLSCPGNHGNVYSQQWYVARQQQKASENTDLVCINYEIADEMLSLQQENMRDFFLAIIIFATPFFGSLHIHGLRHFHSHFHVFEVFQDYDSWLVGLSPCSFV